METSGPAPRKRRLESKDLLRMRFVGDVQLSPDGRNVAWVERWIDPEADQYRSRIMVAPADGSGPARAFTAGPGQDKAPRWSPDGRWLAFLSDRPLVPPEASRAGGGATSRGQETAPFQLFVMPADGGEARPLTRLKHGAGVPVWAPDGRRIAFVAVLDTERGLERLGDEDPDEKEPYRRFNRDVQVITRLLYKEDGVGFFGRKRRHLFLVFLDEVAGQEAGGRSAQADGASVPAGPASIPDPVQLTAGEWDVRACDWLADGSRLAIVANPDPDADYQRWSDVYLLPAPHEPAQGAAPETGPGLEKLTRSELRVTDVMASPDGRHLAFTAFDLEYDQYSNHHLYLLDLARNERPPISLTAAADLCVGNQALTDVAGDGGDGVVWAADGSGLFAQVSRRGSVDLLWFGLPGETTAGPAPAVPITPLIEGRQVIQAVSVRSRSGQVAVVMTDPLRPGEVWAGRLDGPPYRSLAGLRQLSHANGALLGEVELSEPEPFAFESGGLRLDGWAIRPVGARPGRRYPVVLEIHGGPMAMYAHAFFFEFQLLAARGYGVIYTNPRGSQGYGQAFCAAIRGDWGHLDYRDVMALVDAALERFDFIDPERLGVAGGSYGGYMTNWIIGHTDRFKAAVTMRSVTNEHSFFGTSDIGVFDLYDLRQPPWADAPRYLSMSPIHYAGQIHTPTLILHSEMDLRCPIEQAEQLYTALKWRKVPVEFVRFAGESHGLSRGGKPWHRVFRLDRIVDWFDRYLGKAEEEQG
ncbi:MAG: S9 family peptidase [Limnochordaceae bacterium]|nr:S9 family peptidase [Limnochordaceae bacterium]